MRLGLGARLALAFALLAGLTALVTAGVSSYSTSRQVNADIDGFLQLRAADIAEGRRLDPEPRNGRPGRGQNNDRNNQRGQTPRDPQGPAEDALDEIRSLVESDAEVQILSEDGNVIVMAGIALPIGDIEEKLLETRGMPVLRTVEIDGEQYRMITRHTDGGGVVQVAQSLTTTNALLRELRTELILVGLGMSALAAIVGWGIAQRTTRPLRRLTTTVETVAATEDLSMPIALDRTDEIGRLSDEFDGLLKTLGASRDQQRRLVQDAAHELRTPLTSVRANIDFLERAKNIEEDDRQSTLVSIKSELAELSSILAEVVELATESGGVANFETIDLATVAEAALAQFELRSARPVVRSLAPCEVRGDHDALVRAAGNLIGNADKYSPADLPITVYVADGSFWVADQGPGIADEDKARIFDRFYRSDQARSAPGSGLGLAIVAKAAAEHGGRVWVRDVLAGGAEVGFSIPVAI